MRTTRPLRIQIELRAIRLILSLSLCRVLPGKLRLFSFDPVAFAAAPGSFFKYSYLRERKSARVRRGHSDCAKDARRGDMRRVIRPLEFRSSFSFSNCRFVSLFLILCSLFFPFKRSNGSFAARLYKESCVLIKTRKKPVTR